MEDWNSGIMGIRKKKKKNNEYGILNIE